MTPGVPQEFVKHKRLMPGAKKIKAQAAKKRTTAKKKSVAVAKKKKGDGPVRQPYMTPAEDELLARAYVNASEDPIVGADRKGSVFWTTVQQGYTQLFKESGLVIPGVTTRTMLSLKNRFQRNISPEVQQFNHHCKICKSNNPSGHTEDDIMRLAVENFLEVEGSAFRFIDCVPILQQMPKFNPMLDDDSLDDDDDDDDDDGSDE